MTVLPERRARWPHIGSPITPRPMKPMVSMSGSGAPVVILVSLPISRLCCPAVALCQRAERGEQGMYAAIRGTRIYFDIDGAGLVPDGPRMRERPVAFIIHGGPGSDHSGFKPSMSPLADTMQLVYFDHRGQGRSRMADPDGDPARFTLDENVEDMEALRRHLGLRSIVSVGTSYGGMVAMAHAARYPDTVSHLVLIVTAAHGGFIPRAMDIVRQRGTAEQRRVCET